MHVKFTYITVFCFSFFFLFVVNVFPSNNEKKKRKENDLFKTLKGYLHYLLWSLIKVQINSWGPWGLTMLRLPSVLCFPASYLAFFLSYAERVHPILDDNGQTLFSVFLRHAAPSICPRGFVDWARLIFPYWLSLAFLLPIWVGKNLSPCTHMCPIHLSTSRIWTMLPGSS